MRVPRNADASRNDVDMIHKRKRPPANDVIAHDDARDEANRKR